MRSSTGLAPLAPPKGGGSSSRNNYAKRSGIGSAATSSVIFRSFFAISRRSMSPSEKKQPHSVAHCILRDEPGHCTSASSVRTAECIHKIRDLPPKQQVPLTCLVSIVLESWANLNQPETSTLPHTSDSASRGCGRGPCAQRAVS